MYSPDLAPSDFCHLSIIKSKQVSHADSDSLLKQITKICTYTFEEGIAFFILLRAMHHSIYNSGDYFEPLIK